MADTRSLCAVLGVEITPGGLRYKTFVDDVPVGVYLMKAPDIGRLLRQDVLDLGLTGDEWLIEHDVPGERWCFEMTSYTASVCLLMKHGDVREPRWLRSVVTPHPNLAGRLLRDLVPDGRIIAVAGSSEGLVPDVGDACLDLMETGSTARANGLVVRLGFGSVTTHLAQSQRFRAEYVEPVVKLLAESMVTVS
jgi:ATP phosphoribosyltransferase